APGRWGPKPVVSREISSVVRAGQRQRRIELPIVSRRERELGFKAVDLRESVDVVDARLRGALNEDLQAGYLFVIRGHVELRLVVPEAGLDAGLIGPH